MKPKPRVTHITVTRLYNLGNYEHVRFELGAEVPPGASAKHTLFELAAVAARLRPVKKPYDYERAIEALNKLPEQLSEYEKEKIETYRECVQGYAGAKALQRAAFEQLDTLGGTSKRTDAKLDWQDDDAPW